MSSDRRKSVESEIAAMFMDSVPGEAVRLQPGLLMLELPCGVEVDFERMGDGVRVLFVEDKPNGCDRIDFRAADPSVLD